MIEVPLTVRQFPPYRVDGQVGIKFYPKLESAHVIQEETEAEKCLACHTNVLPTSYTASASPAGAVVRAKGRISIV